MKFFMQDQVRRRHRKSTWPQRIFWGIFTVAVVYIWWQAFPRALDAAMVMQ